MAIFLRFFFIRSTLFYYFLLESLGIVLVLWNGGVNDLQVSEITDGVYRKLKQKGFSVSLRLFCLER